MATFTADVVYGTADEAVHETSAGAYDSTVDYLGAIGGTKYHPSYSWDNVTIPQGATIDSAILEIYSTSPLGGAPTVDIYGDDEDDMAKWSTSDRPSGRAKTTATVNWSVSHSGAGNSPDLKTIVQEIVNRAGWASGNRLGIMFVVSTATDSLRDVQLTGGTDRTGTIIIDYTASAGGGSPAPVRRRFIRH